MPRTGNTKLVRLIQHEVMSHSAILFAHTLIFKDTKERVDMYNMCTVLFTGLILILTVFISYGLDDDDRDRVML